MPHDPAEAFAGKGGFDELAAEFYADYGQYFTAGMLRDYIMYTAFNSIKYVDILPHEALLEAIDTEDEPYSE